MTKREQMLECIEEIESRQAALEGHDIWQDELVWWLCKAVRLLLEERVRDERSDKPLGGDKTDSERESR